MKMCRKDVIAAAADLINLPHSEVKVVVKETPTGEGPGMSVAQLSLLDA